MTWTGTPDSYWMASTGTTTYPPLAGAHETEVAVVGGGIAGLSTAWELVRAGHSVALIEADRIAAGTTGYTTAKLTAQHGLIYAYLRDRFDAETASRYARSQTEAVEHLIATAAELGIECEIERRPAYTYVTAPDRVAEIAAEADAARQAGLPAAYVIDTDLPFPVAGAVRVENQAQFHPRRYLLGLAEELIRRGGRIYERSRVTDLDEGRPCRLTTESGATITAQHIVVATGYPVFDRALLFTRLAPRRELVVAGVIPADADPSGMYLTTEDDTRSVRTAPYRDGQRLLIVTGEAFTPGADDVPDRFRRLAEWTQRHFSPAGVAFHWAAQDGRSTDRLPYIGRLHPGARHAWVATGFNAWGMSNGVLAGRLLAARISGETPEWTDLYDPVRIHPTVEAGNFVKTNLAVARHFVGDRLRSSHLDRVDDLAAGAGAIVRIRGERCAVYRDDGGDLHVVSATCTHLGCLVAFNDAERTWECPCHGSRFGPDGTVLQGPATRPLARREPPD